MMLGMPPSYQQQMMPSSTLYGTDPSTAAIGGGWKAKLFFFCINIDTVMNTNAHTAHTKKFQILIGLAYTIWANRAKFKRKIAFTKRTPLN
jgi:hypothetical protein